MVPRWISGMCFNIFYFICFRGKTSFQPRALPMLSPPKRYWQEFPVLVWWCINTSKKKKKKVCITWTIRTHIRVYATYKWCNGGLEVRLISLVLGSSDVTSKLSDSYRQTKIRAASLNVCNCCSHTHIETRAVLLTQLHHFTYNKCIYAHRLVHGVLSFVPCLVLLCVFAFLKVPCMLPSQTPACLHGGVCSSPISALWAGLAVTQLPLITDQAD